MLNPKGGDQKLSIRICDRHMLDAFSASLELISGMLNRKGTSNAVYNNMRSTHSSTSKFKPSTSKFKHSTSKFKPSKMLGLNFEVLGLSVEVLGLNVEALGLKSL